MSREADLQIESQKLKHYDFDVWQRNKTSALPAMRHELPRNRQLLVRLSQDHFIPRSFSIFASYPLSFKNFAKS